MINSKEIDSLISKKVLTEDEIISLMKMTSGEIFLLMKHPRKFKKKVMLNIYWNPSLLYDSNFLSENMIESLITFVDYRYTIEKSEIEIRKSEGYLSSSEYQEYLENLEQRFFPTDNVVSNNIKRIIFSKKEKTYKL